MTRARARSDSNSVQLFPFLAVLLCMMGALILLLVVIARHARAQASAQVKLTAPVAAASAAEEKARREELDWRREQLTAQRDRTQAELSERRLELGHFEEHARSLRAELDELERAQAQLDQLASTDEDQKRELAARVAAINSQISETQAKLLRARQQLEAQPTSYSIIPYLGPNSTGRPPLYIECRNDRVILQPEGVVLTAEDFEGPLGPSNPLASALRAAREHMARNRRTNAGEMGEPYPLLLVRPDGIMAYWMARAALESWGSDFGYELVDADWKLDFKTPDTELARTEETAVAEARVQQRELAAMMPRLQGQSVGRQYRASSQGGIVADEELPEEDRPGHRKYGAARNGRGGYFDPYPQSNPASRTAAAGGAAGSAFGQGGPGSGFQGNGTGSAYPGGAFQGGPAGGHSLMGGNDGGLYPGEATIGSSTPGGPTGPGGPMTSGSGTGGFAAGGGSGGSSSTGSSFAGSGSGNSNGNSSGDASGGQNGNGSNGAGPNGGGQSAGDPNGTGQMAAAGAAGFAAGAAANGTNGSAGDGAPGGTNGNANGTGSGGAGSESSTGGAADGPKLAAPGGAPGAAGGDTASGGGISSGGDPNGTQLTNASNPDSGGPSRGGQPGAPDARNPFSSPLDSYGTSSARSGAPGGTSVTSPSSSGASGGGSGAGGTSGGAPSVSKSPPAGSMAEHRGKNWAVPTEMRRVAPVTRPVMIRCSQSSLVILADDGSGKQVRAVPLGERTEDAVDDLLTGVWDHITSWGLAGHGMYWHPVLVLDTTADGQARAADLKRLMASSGIDVRDKQVNPPVARAKKKRWWQW